MDFVIDGYHASDYGVTLVRGTDRSMTPAVKGKIEQVALRPGAYDFGAEYGERKFNLKCLVSGTSREKCLENWRKFAKILDIYRYTSYQGQSHQLIFSDEPDRYYKVRLDGAISGAPESAHSAFTLPLIAADPFAYSVDSNWSSHELVGDPSIVTEYAGGNVPALPLWTLICGTEVYEADIVLLNATSGQSITWQDGLVEGDVLEINSEAGQVKKNGAVSMSGLAPGVMYPQLLGGKYNRIKVSGMIGVLNIEYTRRYL